MKENIFIKGNMKSFSTIKDTKIWKSTKHQKSANWNRRTMKYKLKSLFPKQYARSISKKSLR